MGLIWGRHDPGGPMFAKDTVTCNGINALRLGQSGRPFTIFFAINMLYFCSNFIYICSHESNETLVAAEFTDSLSHGALQLKYAVRYIGNTQRLSSEILVWMQQHMLYVRLHNNHGWYTVNFLLWSIYIYICIYIRTIVFIHWSVQKLECVVIFMNTTAYVICTLTQQSRLIYCQLPALIYIYIYTYSDNCFHTLICSETRMRRYFSRSLQALFMASLRIT